MAEEKREDNGIGLPDPNKTYWTGEEPRLINGRVEMQPTAKSLFIVDGKGYGLTKDGFTFCAGPVDLSGKPVRDVATDRHQTTPDKQNNVSKPLEDKTVQALDNQAQNNGGFETSKNVGGRPRKTDEDEMSRVTKWRRKKEQEKQGVLFDAIP